jgi:hypothetical protein
LGRKDDKIKNLKISKLPFGGFALENESFFFQVERDGGQVDETLKEIDSFNYWKNISQVLATIDYKQRRTFELVWKIGTKTLC